MVDGRIFASCAGSYQQYLYSIVVDFWWRSAQHQRRRAHHLLPRVLFCAVRPAGLCGPWNVSIVSDTPLVGSNDFVVARATGLRILPTRTHLRCSTKSSTCLCRLHATAARYHVSEGTLKCLSALPLRIREDERARAKARVKSKNRKRRREGSVEAGLMEADARVDDDVRAKCQADALHEVRHVCLF